MRTGLATIIVGTQGLEAWVLERRRDVATPFPRDVGRQTLGTLAFVAPPPEQGSELADDQP